MISQSNVVNSFLVTDLAEKIEKQSKEQKRINKITSDSFPKGSCPMAQSNILQSSKAIQSTGWGPEVKPNIKEGNHQEKASSKTETKGSFTE